ncbi:MAG: hypothetical protein JWN57_2414 [Frankiales bacterium]|nr:hypothetical protein [Frankiales bacterium]
MPRRLHDLRAEDGGYALVVVMGVMSTLLILSTFALSLAMGQVRPAKQEQEFHVAMAAAQAGAEDYVSRVNRTGVYYSGTGGFAGWVAVPTPSAATPVSSFRYELAADPAAPTVPVTNDATQAKLVQQTGRVELVVTGCAGTPADCASAAASGPTSLRNRTIRVTLKRGSFLDYLYFTRYETEDPVTSWDLANDDPADDTARQANCAAFAGARDDTLCRPVLFNTGDTLYGPVHSEDRFLMSGTPVFEDEVDSGWPDATGTHWATPNSATPTFKKGPPTYAPLDMPSTNGELRSTAACRFYGPTRVIFRAGGTMDVTSPWSGSTPCGSFTPASPTVTGISVATFPVLWVDPTPAATSCTLAEQRTLVGFPAPGDDSLEGGTSPLFHNCRSGDAFVEGWVKGQVTVAAANNVTVTGPLRYVGVGGDDLAGTDVLGLYAQRFVTVYHPVTCSLRDPETSYCLDGTNVSPPVTTLRPQAYPLTNVQIDAAIVAPNNSFLLPTTTAPALGTLKVLGAIVQQFRGPIAARVQFASMPAAQDRGYRKDYRYDPRLRFMPPPALADLGKSAWSVRTFSE